MTPLLVLSPLILLAALGAVWLARPVHAALLLALALALIAVFFLTAGADFIGLVQFMVYVGAIAVLIVFSLLITRPGDEAEELLRRPRSLATGLACTLPVLGVLLYTVAQTGGNAAGFVSSQAAPPLPVARLGTVLFTSHAPAVLAVGVLLTAVMIGAALFARETRGVPRPASRAPEAAAEPPTPSNP